MISIFRTIRNKQILLSTAVLFAFQIFVGFSITLILFLREDIYVDGTGSQMEGIYALMIAHVISIFISIIIYLFMISRVRTLTLVILGTILGLLVFIILVYGGLGGIVFSSAFIGAVVILSFWEGFLIYGLSHYFYFKMRNVFLTISVLAVWHFGVISLSVSDRIEIGESLSLSNVMSRIGSIMTDPIYLSLTVGFLLFSFLIMIVDTKLQISRWFRDMQTEAKIGWKNLGAAGCLFFFIVILTLIFAPLFWRLHYETTYREDYEREQRREEQEEEQERQEEERRRQNPPQDGNQNSPPTTGDQYNSGGRIETKTPRGSGRPIFVVRIGESDSQLADSENNIVFISGENTEIPEDNYFWRADVFDSYSQARGFYKSRLYEENAYTNNRLPGYYYSGEDKKYVSSVEVEQKFYIIDTASESVFALNRPIEVNYLNSSKIPYFFGFRNQTIITDQTNYLAAGSKYYVRSEYPNPSENELLKASTDRDYTTDNYYPYYFFNWNLDIYELANRITSEYESDYEKVKAIENYLKTYYKFERPGETSEKLSQDEIVDFLYTTKVGDINHFTGAMVMLLDQIDIDSRIAAGYTMGEYDEELDGYIVRDNNFYYWVEVYFRDYGWINFDPLGQPTDNELQMQREHEQESQDQNQQDQQWRDLDEDLRDEIEREYDEFNEQEQQDDLDQKRDVWEDLDQNERDSYERYREEMERREREEREQEREDEREEQPRDPQEERESQILETLQNIIQAIINFLKYTWWLCCLGIIVLFLTAPPILKQAKIEWRKGRFSSRNKKEQILQYYELLQDDLRAFGEEMKITETSLKFAERFVEEFPIDQKDEQLRNELYTLAMIYNRTRFSNENNSDDIEKIEALSQIISEKYLRTKGVKIIFRWYNPSSFLKR